MSIIEEGFLMDVWNSKNANKLCHWRMRKGVEMEERKWENLELDCLANVFGRVGLESLLLDVPFVCKSWYKASLDPSCWKELTFPQNIKSDSTTGVEMEERKWENLEPDCFANVFGRVGLESLLLDVPFVCKSWYKACLDPSCWKQLAFLNIKLDWRTDNPLLDRFVDKCKIEKGSVDAFIKFIVGRSHGNCTYLVLPNGCTEEVIKYIADECPALIALFLPSDILYKSSIIPTLVGKWEHLEILMLGCSGNFVNIITQIRVCCKKFAALRVMSACIEEAEALAIVTNLPNLKYLVLREARINLESLVIILKGCKNLVYFDVSNSFGFNPDEKVLELASHIGTFNCDNCWVFDNTFELPAVLYDYDDHDAYYDEYDI